MCLGVGSFGGLELGRCNADREALQNISARSNDDSSNSEEVVCVIVGAAEAEVAEKVEAAVSERKRKNTCNKEASKTTAEQKEKVV